MLTVKNITKKYNPNITVLENVSFEVREKSFSCIIGHSGAGKTTLVRLLLRKELPTTGEIWFNDIDICSIPNNLLSTYRQNIGVVFQDYKLIPTKTTYENIAFAMEVLGKSNREIKEKVPQVIDHVGLQGKGNIYPNYLSGGEQQRVAIARALINNPILLIADEPTGNLDQKTASSIINLLHRINDHGTTVLSVTHDQQIIHEVSTQNIIKLKDGRILN